MSKTKRLETIDGESLMSLPLTPLNFVVDTLLSQGLHILAGSPKVGKSWLALWLSVMVAKGEPVWGMSVKQGTTLYLCLEDSTLRIQNRLFEITEDAPANVHFTTQSDILGKGLEEQFRTFLDEHPDTVLVIIDTLQMVRPVRDATYANDYRDLSALKQIADAHGIAILLIHHLRKESADDVFNRISGTTAISGAVDSSFTLVEERRGSGIIVDPMGEYAPLVRRLGGQVVEIAPGSPSHINPMDIQLDLDDDESPLSMKADFLLSLCELVVGGKDGLQPIEKTVIDRCVRLIYRDMALGIGDGKPPLLQDLYEELLKQPEPEARRVATALELYCTGSLNLFNHQTNVKLTSHIVCIVLKGLGENLRKIAMHVTNDFVTSAVNVNFHSGVSTWCYFDEFHILLRDALTASYFVAVWKMLRKKGCVPSALTQNVKDLLASREIEAILDNTDFMILLSQAQSDRAILAKQLGISEHQLSYITHSNSGEGLLFYGDVTIPFVDRFPRGEIYNLLTTRPEDLKNEAKTE